MGKNIDELGLFKCGDIVQVINPKSKYFGKFAKLLGINTNTLKGRIQNVYLCNSQNEHDIISEIVDANNTLPDHSGHSYSLEQLRPYYRLNNGKWVKCSDEITKKEQWKSLGNRVKVIEQELSSVLIESQTLIKNKRDLGKLLKAIKCLSEFKSDADRVMNWNSRPISNEDLNQLKSVFYG